MCIIKPTKLRTKKSKLNKNVQVMSTKISPTWRQRIKFNLKHEAKEGKIQNILMTLMTLLVSTRK